jgi:hypothetical protein
MIIPTLIGWIARNVGCSLGALPRLPSKRVHRNLLTRPFGTIYEENYEESYFHTETEDLPHCLFEPLASQNQVGNEQND